MNCRAAKRGKSAVEEEVVKFHAKKTDAEHQDRVWFGAIIGPWEETDTYMAS